MLPRVLPKTRGYVYTPNQLENGQDVPTWANPKTAAILHAN